MTKLPLPPPLARLRPPRGYPGLPLQGTWQWSYIPSPGWRIWQLVSGRHRADHHHVRVQQWAIEFLYHRRLRVSLECKQDVSRPTWRSLSSSLSRASKSPRRDSANRCRQDSHPLNAQCHWAGNHSYLLTLSANVMSKFTCATQNFGAVAVQHLDKLFNANKRVYYNLLKRCHGLLWSQMFRQST